MSDVTLSKAVRTNLLSLQSTAQLMEKTQQRLATGNKVNTALDNPSNFFTASSLNSRAADMSTLIDGMANGVKTLEAADNALSAITNTLESMNSTLRQARQDKSFQVASFDVNANTVLNFAGGTLNPDGINVKLAAPDAGTKATVTSANAFNGPTAASYGANNVTDADAAGAGSRTVLTLKTLATDLASRSITVDGKVVNFTGTAVDLNSIVTQLQNQLGEGYKVGQDTSGGKNRLVIENISTTGPDSVPPVVDFGTGVPVATQDSITFTYDAERFGGTVSVGDEDVVVNGSGVDDFVASLKSQLDRDGKGDFSISNDGNNVTVTRKAAGDAGGIAVAGTAAVKASSTFSVGAITEAAPRTDETFTVAGQTVTLTWGTDAGNTNTLMAGRIETALNQAGLGAANYNVSFDSSSGEVSIEAKNAGAGAAPEIAGTALDGTATYVQGKANLVTSKTDGVDGITTAHLEAASQKFTVTYANQDTEIKVGVGSSSQIAASINEQLTAARIKVEASFDAENKLVLSSSRAETETLAVSDGDFHTIFGGKTSAIGKDATAPLNADKAVDKFVELINRDHGTSLRASNDNGRLRIENLSTSRLEVISDKDGDGSPTSPTTISGNSVREGLSTQFNQLKDQLNKLADDASYNGVNLLRGDQLTITFNETGNSFMQIKAGDKRGVNSQTLNLNDLVGSDFDKDSDIDALLGNIKLALNSVRSQASAFGSNLSIVQNRQDFTKNMINTLQTGASNLTLADMNEEAANLLALQTRQSLSSSALSMASQADQNILQLLR